MDDFTGADIAAGMSGGGDPSPSPEGGGAAPLTETTTAATGTGTTAPAAVSPQQPPARPTGPIPFDVHTRALDNARIKALEEYKGKHGWAETVNQQEYQQVARLAQRLSGPNAVDALAELIQEMNQNPAHAEALRSHAARALAAGRQAPQMPEPDVTITDEHGNPVGQTYSAPQLAKRDAWLKDQFLGDVRKEMAPIVQSHKTQEAQRQQEHAEAEGKKFAGGLIDELKAYPHFDANKTAIGADVLRQIQQFGDDPRTNDPAWLEAATMRAYHRVVTTQQDALSRQAAIADTHTKATGTGVVPGRAPVGAPKRGTDGRFTAEDFRDAFARRNIG